MGLPDRIAGHVLTVAPVVQARLSPSAQLSGESFRARFHDLRVGEVSVSGWLTHRTGTAPLLVIVHGLGGSSASPYMQRLARIAHGAGLNTLLLNLRGADRSGDDIYHAGLTADLDAALASPALARYSRIAVLGCSMGGHMVLRWGLSPGDPRVRAIAALCAPLDLEQGAQDIDQLQRFVYRSHLLRALKDIYAPTHARRRVHTDLARVQAVRTLRAWDELAVVPRFGFASVEHYWRDTQVATHLASLLLPTRIVLAKHDPMVLARPLHKYVQRLPHHVHVDWVDGGHLGFSRTSRVERELVAWLTQSALT